MNGEGMDALISVVIPVYNVSKYLDRCLRTVVNQTYTNLEIILVDDGSTDSCPAICDEWARRDRRISVIHKKNAGLGMARNTGIEHATGQYICFFDSDDYIDLQTIAHAAQMAEKERADVVVFGMTFVDKNGNFVRQRIPVTERDCFQGSEVLEHFLPSLLHYTPSSAKVKKICLSACVCLFSLEMIRQNNWRFASERQIISEDVYSLLGLYRYVERVAVLKEPLYHYCENDSSLTRSYRADRFERNKKFYLECLELCKACDYPPIIERCCIGPFLGNVIGVMKQEIAVQTDRKEAMRRLRGILEDELLQKVLRIRRRDYESRNATVLLWVMRYRCIRLCYALIVASNRG